MTIIIIDSYLFSHNLAEKFEDEIVGGGIFKNDCCNLPFCDLYRVYNYNVFMPHCFANTNGIRCTPEMKMFVRAVAIEKVGFRFPNVIEDFDEYGE